MTRQLRTRYAFSVRPTGRSGDSASTALSLLLHVLIIALLLVPLRRDFARVLDTGNPLRAPGGGGGGGGGVAYITLPAPKASAPVAVPVAPTVQTPPPVPVVTPPVVTPPPEPVPQATPPVAEAPVTAPDSTTGTGAGPGQGGGTGGGQGGGQGPGSGPGSGPGDGGGGGAGKGRAVQLRHQVLPPQDPPKELRGVSIKVTLWIDATGKVERVAMDPPVRDGKYASQLRDVMMSYRYRPALGPDGAPVASTDVQTVTIF